MKALSLRLLAPLLVASALAGVARAAPSDDVEWIADKNGCKVANPFPRAGETITWTGTCKNGFADGEGVLQWFYNGKQDDRYEGNLARGWAEGRGTLFKSDGGKYDGEWQQSLQNGMGRYEAPDGSWYDGQWKNGKPNGNGQYRRPDGRMFMGQWSDGVFEGDEDDGNQPQKPDDPNRT
jgi:hypothetical protein